MILDFRVIAKKTLQDTRRSNQKQCTQWIAYTEGVKLGSVTVPKEAKSLDIRFDQNQLED